MTLGDGVRLAVDLYRPSGDAGKRYCTALVNTRYGRRTGLSPDARAALLTVPTAIVIIDARGTGASFGRREAELSAREMRDAWEIIDWIVSQPWSDGRVVAMGNSYSGDASDIIVGMDHPAVVGAVSRFTEFDAYAHLMFPGAVRNRMMAQEWGALTASLDTGADVRSGDFTLEDHPHLAPVDSDVDRAELAAALAEHIDNYRVDRAINRCEFRDDEIAPGLSFDDLSIFARTPPSLTRPSQYFGSWTDGGTALSAISRFLTVASAPMEVFIGAWSHGGLQQTDPFEPDGEAPSMPGKPQYFETAEFLKRLLNDEVTDRKIHYYTLGSGRWRSTTQWPPANVRPMRFYTVPGNRLAADPGAQPEISHYDIDYSATTGERSRWYAQMGVIPRYEDRSAENEKLLCFTSDALRTAIEVTGSPIVTLRLATDADTAIFAYLEAVGPNGASTYLTEGQLRLACRKLGEAPYAHDGPWPTCRREDFSPSGDGQWVTVSFAMFPISALVPAGHAIRVSIAGADHNTFARYPADEAVASFDIQTGSDESFIQLPAAEWTPH